MLRGVAIRKAIRHALLGASMVAATGAAGIAPALAQQYKGEIFHPLLVTRTGPFATAASAVSSGQEDYFALINAKGGVEGYKIVWEECEFEYKTPRALECYERYRGKWKIVYPNSTPAIFALADRVTADEVLAINLAGGRSDSSDGKTFPYLAPVVDSFWSQASSTIRYIAQQEGGEAKLKGKKIAYIHLDNDYGRQPFPIFDALAQKYGFEWKSWALPWPALEQSAAWVEIARRYQPDYVIGWLYGQSCSVPFTELQKVGFPSNKYIASLWCGSEEDVKPAGELAVGNVAANFHGVGPNYPVIQEIIEKVHKQGKGNIETSRVGSVAYNRGVITGIVIVESFRNALKSQGAPLTGKKVRDGFRQIQLTHARLKELGADGLLPPLVFSDTYHGGLDPQVFQKWDGTKWTTVSDWIKPYDEVVNIKVDESARAYRDQAKPNKS
jgi:branched-chain amino acid transport system substrate-binding protein